MRRNYIPKTYKKQAKTKLKSKSRSFIIEFLKFLIFVIIAGGCGYLLYSPILNIVKFEVILEDEILKDNIISRTQSIVEEQTSWWYNNKNILLLRANKLEKVLLQEFPQIKSITIKRHVGNRIINLDIILRTPTFYSCADGECYNIGEDGVNMGNNLAINKSLPEIKGLSLEKVGEGVLSDREMIWLKNILQEYNKIDNIKITAVDIQQKVEYSIVSVFVYTEKGYYIMLDLDTDVIYQAQVLKQVFISQIPVERQDSLEYIDLRIKDRAYYKFK